MYKQIIVSLVTALATAAIILIIQQVFWASTNLEKYGEDMEDDSEAIQKAIDEAQEEKSGLVKLTGKKQYVIRSGLIIKEGVTLQLDQNTKILIDGNFRAIELEKNASIENGILEVIDPKFKSEVIFLDGKHKFWSWERTQVNNVSIINASGSHQGTAISLHAKGNQNFISFVNFINNKIAGFKNGIFVQVEHNGSSEDHSWVNGNRFINTTLDDCINFIVMDSAVTVPNESSGNQFSGLQIQPSKITKSILKVSGSYNNFEGMVWDQHLVKQQQEMILLTPESSNNEIKMNIETNFIWDEGNNNVYSE